jgi:hypothetical protein
VATAPPISFVIPVRNDARRLRTCLDAITRAAAVGTSEVIVVDNGSDDGSDQVGRDAGAIVLSVPEGSVGQLRNRGAAIARGPALAFVDADNEIAPGWVSAALENLGRDPSIVAAGAPYSAPLGGNWVQRAYDSLRSHQRGVVDTEWLGSGNLVIRRQTFERIGGFDGTLQTCEDVDLCRRVRALGLRLVADSRMRSIHHGDPQTLRAVFFGELWRGRDNLRVSVRPPVTLRVLASLAVSALQLVSLIAILGGGIAVFVAPLSQGVAFAAAGAAVFATIVVLRAARMIAKRDGGGLMSGPGTVLVAGTYELARALALAVGASHGRRRAEDIR